MTARKYLLILAMACCLPSFARADNVVRPMVAAGVFYPEKSRELRDMVRKFENEASVPETNARLVACITPHSGYEFSGAVAAHAFKNLKSGVYDKVIILAPSHFTGFFGCSIPLVQAYFTPLGLVPLDDDIVRRVCFSSMISQRDLRYNQKNWAPLHETEYSIEVVLPFLQDRMDQFAIIPILVGDLRTPEGKIDQAKLSAVADSIRHAMTDRTLLIVSSDFTHYGKDFNYVPFKDNILASVEAMDKQAIQLLLNHDIRGFDRFLAATKSTICGRTALQVLLRILPDRIAGQLLAYDMSANKTHNTAKCVGYAAINFYDTSLPPLAPKPKEAPIVLDVPTPPGPQITEAQPIK